MLMFNINVNIVIMTIMTRGLGQGPRRRGGAEDRWRR